jgi:L-fuconolactonase
MIIIDAHQHYWQPARGDYGWLAQAPEALRRPFLPADLQAQRDAAGVQFSVLVQAASSEEETRYLFALARTDPAVIGVVGWVDLEAADASARIGALVRDGDGLLCGIRPMVQDISDPGWLARPSLDRAFNSLLQHGLAFDALVGRAQFPALLQRLQRHPGLRVVLDHAGKPAIATGDFRPWANAIDTLAQQPQLHCKLSGLLTQLSDEMHEAAIEPYVGHLFLRFGARRLMWGSDWPVVTTRTGYVHWLRLARRLAARYAPGHHDALFGHNAMRFYALKIDTPIADGATP